jgi:hypothetical protein
VAEDSQSRHEGDAHRRAGEATCGDNGCARAAEAKRVAGRAMRDHTLA